jgi:SAM-dependent methyltransferase
LSEERLQVEIAYGQQIRDVAEEVWQWDSRAGRLRAERRAQLIAKYAEVGGDRVVLELGCGTGLITQLISSYGGRIASIDVSSDLLALASSRNLPGVKFLRGDIENLPVADESCDAVVGSSVLHHTDITVVFSEIRRVLRVGGRFAFAEPNMVNPQILIQKKVPWIKERAGDTPHETAYVRWSLPNKIGEGFEVHAFPYDFLHPLVPDRLVPFVCRAGLILERLPVVREIAGSLIITGRWLGT